MPPRFSIIITCKGRLENLKATLPGFLAQQDAEVIVVDYDCPDGTRSYLARHHPAVRVVAVDDRPVWNASKARNLGAAQALADFLVFMDADVQVSAQFLEGIRQSMQPNCFGTFKGAKGNSIRGSCAVERSLFEEIAGYDEVIEGYGGEDLDLYARLRIAGGHQVFLAEDCIIEVIEQTRQERERFRGPFIRKQFLRGMIYLLGKDSMMRILDRSRLAVDVRQRIYAAVDRQLDALVSGKRELELRIQLPDMFRRGLLADWEFSRQIVINVRRKRPPEAPQRRSAPGNAPSQVQDPGSFNLADR